MSVSAPKISTKEAATASMTYDDALLKRYIRQTFLESLEKLRSEVACEDITRGTDDHAENSSSTTPSESLAHAYGVIDALAANHVTFINIVALEARRRQLEQTLVCARHGDAYKGEGRPRGDCATYLNTARLEGTPLSLTGSQIEDTKQALEEVEDRLRELSRGKGRFLSLPTFSDGAEGFCGNSNESFSNVSSTAMVIMQLALMMTSETLSQHQNVVAKGKGGIESSANVGEEGVSTTTTLLHLAAYAGSEECAHLLTAFGADVNAKEGAAASVDEKVAVGNAARHGADFLASSSTSPGSPLNSTMAQLDASLSTLAANAAGSPLFSRRKGPIVGVVFNFQPSADDQSHDVPPHSYAIASPLALERTLLSFEGPFGAAKRGVVSASAALIQPAFGLNVDKCHLFNGKTPLHWAAFEGHDAICRHLLACRQFAEQETAEGADGKAFSWLPIFSHTCDPTPLDASRQTPCHLAILNKKHSTAALFPDYYDLTEHPNREDCTPSRKLDDFDYLGPRQEHPHPRERASPEADNRSPPKTSLVDTAGAALSQDEERSCRTSVKDVDTNKGSHSAGDHVMEKLGEQEIHGRQPTVVRDEANERLLKFESRPRGAFAREDLPSNWGSMGVSATTENVDGAFCSLPFERSSEEHTRRSISHAATNDEGSDVEAWKTVHNESQEIGLPPLASAPHSALLILEPKTFAEKSERSPVRGGVDEQINASCAERFVRSAGEYGREANGHHLSFLSATPIRRTGSEGSAEGASDAKATHRIVTQQVAVLPATTHLVGVGGAMDEEEKQLRKMILREELRRLASERYERDRAAWMRQSRAISSESSDQSYTDTECSDADTKSTDSSDSSNSTGSSSESDNAAHRSDPRENAWHSPSMMSTEEIRRELAAIAARTEVHRSNELPNDTVLQGAGRHEMRFLSPRGGEASVPPRHTISGGKGAAITSPLPVKPVQGANTMGLGGSLHAHVPSPIVESITRSESVRGLSHLPTRDTANEGYLRVQGSSQECITNKEVARSNELELLKELVVAIKMAGKASSSSRKAHAPGVNAEPPSAAKEPLHIPKTHAPPVRNGGKHLDEDSDTVIEGDAMEEAFDNERGHAAVASAPLRNFFAHLNRRQVDEAQTIEYQRDRWHTHVRGAIGGKHTKAAHRVIRSVDGDRLPIPVATLRSSLASVGVGPTGDVWAGGAYNTASAAPVYVGASRDATVGVPHRIAAGAYLMGGSSTSLRYAHE